MQAGSLWAGHEYAYSMTWSGKGQWPRKASRVKVIKVTKRKNDIYSERASTWVEVQMLDRDSGVPTSQYTRTLRGRDIIDFWDAYAKWENELVEEERRKERERKEAEARTTQEAAEVKEKFLEHTGFPYPDLVKVDVKPYMSNPEARVGPIRIIYDAQVKEWLGILDASTDEAGTIFGSEWERFEL